MDTQHPPVGHVAWEWGGNNCANGQLWGAWSPASHGVESPGQGEGWQKPHHWLWKPQGGPVCRGAFEEFGLLSGPQGTGWCSGWEHGLWSRTGGVQAWPCH